jgi:CubicO group peptidase (beta-lactamase class C family)
MDAEALRSELAALAAEHAVPGAQVGLLRGDDRVVVCAGTYGVGDATPVGPEALFHAGSIAKALTALTVLDAARRGEVDLDAPCSAQGPGQWDHPPRAILAQTTGAPNLLPDQDETLEAFVARTAALPPVHPPGRLSYCNAGWSALDLLLRQTTGAGFEESAQTLLARPLAFGVPDGATAGHTAAPGQPPTPVPLDFWPAASAAGSRWWATADDLLDHARLHLHDGEGLVDPEVVRGVRAPGAPMPGATVADGWAHGWALWDRGDHRAFGWAGFTGGHRAYLRCFPDQDAALVVLANSAGPMFGPPGGSALMDALLPSLLEHLGVPPLPEPSYDDEPVGPADLAGRYGPIGLEAVGADTVRFDGSVFGSPGPVTGDRLGGNTFAPVGRPPGAMPFAVDGDLLYVGPFAFPRVA